MADRHLERLEGLAASGSATGEAGRGRRRALRMPVPLGATGEAGIRDVVASIDAGSATGERDLAIILLSHCTGLRGIDIRRLKPTDIDRRGQSVSLTQSKNHGPITCALNGETMSALADHVLEGRPDRDRFLLSLLFESGGRIGEVLALKAGDLRPTGRGEADAHFYGKGNKHRVAPLASDPWRHHSEFERACHPGGADPSDLLFYVVRDGRRHMMSHDDVERILARSGKALRAGSFPDLQHLHSHLFRRSRAMHLYLAGVPLPTTSDWLGRSNMETARFYAKVTEVMKREAVDKLAEGPGSVFDIGVPFKYANDEEALKRLCGLR